MPGLAETTAMLARLRRASSVATGGQGRLARTDNFGPNPGQLTMLSYRPERLAPRSPLVVVLHGCTQTAEAYAGNAGWLALADRFGFMVVAVEQSPANNPNRCFNWFSPGDVRRGEGEAGSIAAMVNHAIQAHDLDGDRIFITGLSAGGAMAAAMLAVYPDLFAGGAVIAGLPYGVARNVQEALSVMNRADGRTAGALGALIPGRQGDDAAPRLSIWHGDADFTVQAGNAHDLAQQWSALHGLKPAPHRVETRPFGTRSIWRSAAGETVIELNVVRGLGHGTPLSTKGAGDIGKVAPFMLEAGISSSLEIARFWRIDGGKSEATGGSVDAAPAAAESDLGRLKAEVAESSEDGGLGHGVMHAIRNTPADVQNVIAKALRAAGLLK